MPVERIHALRIAEDFAELVSDSLRQGEGRFGWSYCSTADLRELSARIERDGFESLSNAEQDCYQQFLLELEPDDYVIFINVPSYGRCTAVRVTAGYFWDYKDDDFNHRFRVDPQSVFEFDRRDESVHPNLQVRLTLPGRHWNVSAVREFESLLESAKAGRLGTPSTIDSKLKLLGQELEPLMQMIARKVKETHPGKMLEDLLSRALEHVPGATIVPKRGRADKGADIIVRIERVHPLTGAVTEDVCVVQVKSYEGEHWNAQAANDIRRAFQEYPEATEGLIMSTAEIAGPTLEDAVAKLRADLGKPVNVLVGSDLAAFVVKYGWDALR